MKIKEFFLTAMISALIGLLAGITIGIIVGIRIEKNENEEQEVITSTVVLDRIKDQSFLVTRTVVTDQKATIKIDQGSDWSNFWWGHEITAEGLMQVDVGVDLTKIGENDIIVNNSAKTISIKLPESEIYDSSLKGEIQVTTKSGILKKLLASDNNEDYNLALSELTKSAKESIEGNSELLEEAQMSALSTLEVILKDTDYKVKLVES